MMNYHLIENIQFLQSPLLVLGILLPIFTGLQSCNREDIPGTACMVSGGIISEYVDPDGNHVRISDNGEAYLIEEGKCNFAVQFFEPGFFEDNYLVADSGTFLKADEGAFFKTFDSFEENFEDYSEPLEFLITDITDRNHFFSSFTLQSPSAKTVDAYVDLKKCIFNGSCDFIDNRFDLMPDPLDASNQVLRFFSVAPSFDMVTSKCSISSTLVVFREGDDFWYEARYYIENVLPTTIADFESSHFEGGPGPRLIFKDNHLAVENKFGEKITYRQVPGSEVVFPLNQWVKVKVHLRYDVEVGTIQLWQDDQLIIDAVGPNMLLNFWIQDRIEVGISATSDEVTLYMDDIRFSHSPL